jgi:hypothetical protein
VYVHTILGVSIVRNVFEISNTSVLRLSRMNSAVRSG